MSPGEGSWKHFPHGADTGLCGYGPTLEAAFEQAALALTGAIADPASIDPRKEVQIIVKAPDRELLLVDWLNALIFEMATRGMLFGRYAVRIEGDKLEGKAWGEPISRERHKPAVEVKGATYTELEVGQDSKGRWVARCVVDV